MSTTEMPFAISTIKDPQSIRVLVYTGSQMGHVALPALLEHMQDQMSQLQQALETCQKRLTALEEEA